MKYGGARQSQHVNQIVAKNNCDSSNSVRNFKTTQDSSAEFSSRLFSYIFVQWSLFDMLDEVPFDLQTN
jgi:hypothetical protein